MKAFKNAEPPVKAALIAAGSGILVALISGIFLLLSRPPAPTPSPTPLSAVSTPTPTIGNSPSPTVTPSTSSSTPYGGTLALDDPLRDHSKGYGWDETEGHCTFKGGAYHVTTSNPNNYECNTDSPRADFSNFAYQVTMKIDQGTKGGICFRFTINDQTGYCFFLDLNGQYVLEKVNFNTPLEEMLVTGQSSYFLTGLRKTNQIAVRAQGSTIDLYVNGHFIRSAMDSSFSHGQIGVFLVYPGLFTEAEFTNAKVWVY